MTSFVIYIDINKKYPADVIVWKNVILWIIHCIYCTHVHVRSVVYYSFFKIWIICGILRKCSLSWCFQSEDKLSACINTWIYLFLVAIDEKIRRSSVLFRFKQNYFDLRFEVLWIKCWNICSEVGKDMYILKKSPERRIKQLGRWWKYLHVCCTDLSKRVK